MEGSASIVESHYEVSMPWKYYPPHLGNNKVMAETRLRYLKRKLQANETLHVKYQAFIDNMVSKGQARQVPQSELNNTSVFYLPHHNVVNPQKPDKCRVVWDCAAKWRGTSLNDQLLRGPDLHPRRGANTLPRRTCSVYGRHRRHVPSSPCKAHRPRLFEVPLVA